MASVFPRTQPCYPNELPKRKLHSGPATRPGYQSCLWNPVPKEFLFGTFWTLYRIGWGISLESLKSKLLGGVLFSNLLNPVATSCHTPSTYGPWQSEQLPKDRNEIQTWTSADDRHLSRKALLRSFPGHRLIISLISQRKRGHQPSATSSTSSTSSSSSLLLPPPPPHHHHRDDHHHDHAGSKRPDPRSLQMFTCILAYQD